MNIYEHFYQTNFFQLIFTQICIAARLCQSLVLGAYTHTLDPENDYLLSTQDNGWKMLSMIWEKPSQELDELWFNTADEYLKQSDKR